MTISDNSILKVNNMPPKGRRVHNTCSVSGTRSNSPLVVKVNNDMAKAKQPKQTKAKLKSIVKVVKNTCCSHQESLFPSGSSPWRIISRLNNRLHHQGRLLLQMNGALEAFHGGCHQLMSIPPNIR